MTNDIPTKLLDIMVTSENYCYKPPTVKSPMKNILVEKNKNGSQPKYVKSVSKKSQNKIFHQKKKTGKFHGWDKIPHSPPVKTINLDSGSGFLP
jgi:hypothetical protein